MTPGPIERIFQKCVARLQEEPRVWIKRTYACGIFFPDVGHIECRCALGLINLYAEEGSDIEIELFLEVIKGRSISTWNDAEERTYDALARARGV